MDNCDLCDECPGRAKHRCAGLSGGEDRMSLEGWAGVRAEDASSRHSVAGFRSAWQ